jgi:hypothetical protein
VNVANLVKFSLSFIMFDIRVAGFLEIAVFRHYNKSPWCQSQRFQETVLQIYVAV